MFHAYDAYSPHLPSAPSASTASSTPAPPSVSFSSSSSSSATRPSLCPSASPASSPALCTPLAPHTAPPYLHHHHHHHHHHHYHANASSATPTPLLPPDGSHPCLSASLHLAALSPSLTQHHASPHPSSTTVMNGTPITEVRSARPALLPSSRSPPTSLAAPPSSSAAAPNAAAPAASLARRPRRVHSALDLTSPSPHDALAMLNAPSAPVSPSPASPAPTPVPRVARLHMDSAPELSLPPDAPPVPGLLPAHDSMHQPQKQQPILAPPLALTLPLVFPPHGVDDEEEQQSAYFGGGQSSDHALYESLSGSHGHDSAQRDALGDATGTELEQLSYAAPVSGSEEHAHENAAAVEAQEEQEEAGHDEEEEEEEEDEEDPDARPVSPLNYFIHNGYRYDGDVYTLRPPQERSIASRPERVLEHKPAPLPHRQLFNRIYSEGTYNARPSSLRKHGSHAGTTAGAVSSTTTLSNNSSAASSSSRLRRVAAAHTTDDSGDAADERRRGACVAPPSLDEHDSEQSVRALLSGHQHQQHNHSTASTTTASTATKQQQHVATTASSAHTAAADTNAPVLQQQQQPIVDTAATHRVPLPVNRPPSVRPGTAAAALRARAPGQAGATLSEAIAAARQTSSAGGARAGCAAHGSVAVARKKGAPPGIVVGAGASETGSARDRDIVLSPQHDPYGDDTRRRGPNAKAFAKHRKHGRAATATTGGLEWAGIGAAGNNENRRPSDLAAAAGTDEDANAQQQHIAQLQHGGGAPTVGRSFSAFAPSQSQAMAGRSGRIPALHRRPSLWRVLSR